MEDVGDGMVNAFAGGLVDKGGVSFVPSFARERFRNMSCFYVGPMGVAYASKFAPCLKNFSAWLTVVCSAG